MTKHVYPGHFCLLVFFQEIWKVKERKKMEQEIITEFLTLKENDPWNEENWDEITLFNPQEPEYNKKLGAWGEINLCPLCTTLNGRMREIQKNNQGLILFHHPRSSSLTHQIIRNLLTFIFQNQKIKKVFLLQVEEIRTTGKISDNKITEIMESLSEPETLPKTEVIKLLNQNKFIPRVIYEIQRDKYF